MGVRAPTIDRARITTILHDSALGRWELVRCRPDPRLSPYVLDYQGYREGSAAPVRRIETAIPAAVMILNFGTPWRLSDGHAPGRIRNFGSFVAGLYSTYAVSENTGAAHCLQINLTPLGARLLFGLPMRDLSERIVDASDVMGAQGRQLEAELAETPDWASRFAIVDRFALSRIANARRVCGEIAFAWRRLSATRGAVPVASLARELGWSRKHLSVRFREDVGLPPRMLARLLRFHAVAERLAATGEVRWSEIAAAAGYYDQAHLIRDFQQFAGMTPGAFVRRRLADGTGVIAEHFAS